jgi:hypothetical protein
MGFEPQGATPSALSWLPVAGRVGAVAASGGQGSEGLAEERPRIARPGSGVSSELLKLGVFLLGFVLAYRYA